MAAAAEQGPQLLLRDVILDPDTARDIRDHLSRFLEEVGSAKSNFPAGSSLSHYGAREGTTDCGVVMEGMRMRKLIVICLSITAGWLVFGTGAQAQSEGSFTVPTLQGRDRIIDRNSETILTGYVRSEDPACYDEIEVTIRGDQADDAISSPEGSPLVARVTTEPSGRYELAIEVERSTAYYALLETPPVGCDVEASNAWSVAARADIALDYKTRETRDGTRVRLKVSVSPECGSVRKEPDVHGIYGNLFLERLGPNGWRRLTSEYDEAKGCTFIFQKPLNKVVAYRVVGEGKFVALPGYEWYWIGKATEPVMVRP